MAIVYLTAVKANDNGSTNVAPCAAIDTAALAANFAVASIAWYAGFGAAYAVQDASSSSGPWTLNNWAPLTAQAEPSSGNFKNQLWYAKNLVTSATHYFRAFANQSYGSITVLVFKGLDATSPFDVQNGHPQNPYTTIQPGGVTPGGPNSLIVTGANNNNDAGIMSIDSGFSTPQQVVNLAGAYQGTSMSYLIQSGGPTGVNPTWTSSNPTYGSATIATFKTPAAAASFKGLSLLGAGA